MNDSVAFTIWLAFATHCIFVYAIVTRISTGKPVFFETRKDDKESNN